MMAIVADIASQTELNWAVLDSGGWEYLIPPIRGQAILCIDSIGLVGAMAARLGARTIVFANDDCEDAVREVMNVSGARDFKVTSFSSWAGPPKDELKELDGVICHDLSGRELGCDGARLKAIIKRVRTSLRSNGFVYLGLRNPYSIDRLLKRVSLASARPASISHITSTLEEAGFSQRIRHPLLLAGDRLQEVIVESGYVSSRNPSRLVERVKQVLFGRIGAKYLAPAYGVVAHVDKARDTLGAKVRQLVAEECFPLHRCDGRVVIKQHLVLNGGKVILRLGLADADDSDVVAVLVRDPQSIARRSRESEILDLLVQSKSSFVKLFPRLLKRLQIDDTHCFVLTKLSGATLDQVVPELEHVTNAAFKFIVAFHCETVCSMVVDSDAFDGLFATLFDSARQRNPYQIPDLLALEEMVRAKVIGVSLPAVWMHGDFKVENVMYDPHAMALSGVIDWELSQNAGLPLLDLHYLHIYNRIIRGHSWIDAFRAVCVSGLHCDAEKRRYSQYIAALRLGKKWIPVLGVMALIHHLGCRFQANIVDERIQAQVSSLMRECVQMLKATSPHATEDGRGGAEC